MLVGKLVDELGVELVGYLLLDLPYNLLEERVHAR